MHTRAATNDYFGNRLIGQLFYRLNAIILLTKNTIPHSAQCPSNKLNAMKTVLNLLDHLS